MLPITLGQASFRYGPIEIPFADVSGAGVGLRKRRHRTYKTLLIGYRIGGAPTPRLISFTMKAADERFADEFRARVPDRWLGETTYFAMRKRLGFSNTAVFAIVAGLTVVVFIAVIGWAISLQHPASTGAPARSGTAAPKR